MKFDNNVCPKNILEISEAILTYNSSISIDLVWKSIREIK